MPDTNRAHVEAIRRHGLAQTGRTESVTKLAAFASAAEMGPRRFDPMYLVKKIRAGESQLTKHAGSMAQDIEAGRETEPEAMTGYVVRKAKELGVPLPVTESVYRMAKGVEYAANERRAKR